MMDAITGLAPAITAATLFATVYALFDYLEKLSSTQAREQVSAWITEGAATRVVERGRAAWILLFSSSFDRTFGTELISWKRVVRSWAISSIVVVAVTLLWAVIRRDQLYAL